jgi:hypothetical protein
MLEFFLRGLTNPATFLRIQPAPRLRVLTLLALEEECDRLAIRPHDADRHGAVRSKGVAFERNCAGLDLVMNLLTLLGSKKSTKLIVKTSRQDQPFLESVKYFGIDAIVLKPISEEHLVKTVRETLNGLRHGSAEMTAGSAA